MKIGIDYFDEGVEMHRKGLPRPQWDGLAITAFLIDGWEHAAKVAGEPGYKCRCISFDCPYHKT